MQVPPGWTYDPSVPSIKGQLPSTGVPGNIVIVHAALPTPTYDLATWAADFKDGLDGAKFGNDTQGTVFNQPADVFTFQGGQAYGFAQLWIANGQAWGVSMSAISANPDTGNAGVLELARMLDAGLALN